MSEADERFIERLRPEIEPVVAAWARIDTVRVDRSATTVAIVIALETRTGPELIRCEGTTLVEATAAVHTTLGEARLGLALRELVQVYGR